jgi:hypothetical protein
MPLLFWNLRGTRGRNRSAPNTPTISSPFHFLDRGFFVFCILYPDSFWSSANPFSLREKVAEGRMRGRSCTA